MAAVQDGSGKDAIPIDPRFRHSTLVPDGWIGFDHVLCRTAVLDHDTARLLAATDLTWKAVCSFIPFFVLERFGRRKLLMFSGGGMTACLVSIGSCHCHEEGIIRKTRLAKRATVEHDADCTSSLLPSAVRRPRTTTRSLPVSAFSLSTPSSFSTPMASSVATGLS